MFSGSANSEQIAADLAARRQAFALLKKPEICDTIETTRSCVYKAPAVPLPPSPTDARALSEARAAADREASAGNRALAASAFKARRGRPPTEVELTELIKEASVAPPNVVVNVEGPASAPGTPSPPPETDEGGETGN